MKLLLYCTKSKPYLIHEEGDYDYNDISCSYDNYSIVNRQYLYDENISLDKTFNGKVVGECDFEVEEIYSIKHSPYIPDEFDYKTFSLKPYELEEKSCLNQQQLFDYLTDDGERYTDDGYAIHIKNLHIFDEPRPTKWYGYTDKKGYLCSVEKAPQNMMYCYDEFGNDYVLISIRPEWLCKILNGEKTIEIRKKVLTGIMFVI